MFCRECGKEIANSAKFCKYCGTKVIKTAVQEEEKPKETPKNNEVQEEEITETKTELLVEPVSNESSEATQIEQVDSAKEGTQESTVWDDIKPVAKKSSKNKTSKPKPSEIDPAASAKARKEADEMLAKYTYPQVNLGQVEEESQEEKEVEEKLGFFKRAGNFLKKWIYDVPVLVVLIAIVLGPLVYGATMAYARYLGPVVGMISTVLVLALFVISFYGQNAVLFRIIRALGKRKGQGVCEWLWAIRFKKFFIVYFVFVAAWFFVLAWFDSSFGNHSITYRDDPTNVFFFNFGESLIAVLAAVLFLTIIGIVVAKFIWNTTSWCPRCGHFHALTRDKRAVGTKQVDIAHDTGWTTKRGDTIYTYTKGTETQYQKDWWCKYCGMSYSQLSFKTRENR